MLSMVHVGRKVYGFVLSFGLLVAASAPPPAAAVPAFTRQTGAPCSTCHTQAFGPYLTPYGRNFKLHGYVDGAGDNPVPLVSGMFLGSFTHVDKPVPPGTEMPGYGAQDAFAFDQASLFLAGRLLPHLGLFTQLTYDGVGDTLALDNTEIRSNWETLLAGQELDFGVSATNAPTVEDLWHTTPTWSYPSTASPLAPTPAAGALLDGALAGQVGGALAYAQFAHLIYVEAGGYASFSKGVQRTLGTFDPGQDQIDGGAPYWRIALQWQTPTQYFEIGHYGMTAEVFPGRVRDSGTDSVTDLAVDANYQYLGDNRNIVELRSTYLREDRRNRAGLALGNDAVLDGTLDEFRLNGSYTFLQTYTASVGYTNLWGSRDFLKFSPDPLGGSRTGKPDSEYFTFELGYVPFGKPGTGFGAWSNLRLGLQYTAYLKFNGAGNDYDGSGRNASDNDTLLLNCWLMF